MGDRQPDAIAQLKRSESGETEGLFTKTVAWVTSCFPEFHSAYEGEREKKNGSSCSRLRFSPSPILPFFFIDLKEKVICGWGEDFSGGGPLGKGIHLILNQVVKRVSIRRPSFDLTLYFADSLMLQVFCDQTELSEEHGLNYALLTPGYSYTVATRSRLVRAERTLK